jgi:pimeloyl-ACP methyl ester carboxylesterase
VPGAPRTAPGEPVDRLILTIPGLWNRGFEAWWLCRRLGATAGCPSLVFRYRTVTADFERSVASLVETVERLPVTPIDLVGHSLGGLLALAGMNRLPPGSIRRAVLLGPPVRGSQAVRSALDGIPGARRVIGRNASLLTSGLSLTPPPAIETGVIAGSGGVGVGRVVTRFEGPNDGTIAVRETRLDGATDRLVLPVTHTGMLFSRAVVDEAVHFLDHGRFRGARHPDAQSASRSFSS